MSKAPITWFGGKSRHLHWMLDQFPSHRVFVDAFGGSGAVLLGKPESAVEVYNDIDGRLVNLFRVLRDSKQSAAFELATSLTAYSREEFELAKLPSDDPVESVTEIPDGSGLIHPMPLVNRNLLICNFL